MKKMLVALSATLGLLICVGVKAQPSIPTSISEEQFSMEPIQSDMEPIPSDMEPIPDDDLVSRTHPGKGNVPDHVLQHWSTLPASATDPKPANTK